MARFQFLNAQVVFTSEIIGCIESKVIRRCKIIISPIRVRKKKMFRYAGRRVDGVLARRMKPSMEYSYSG